MAKGSEGDNPPPGLASLATATGSQVGATLGLALPAFFLMPDLNGPAAPGLHAWLAIVAVAILCTGVAYILYFRLIQAAGPQRALTVTFLIPVFGVAYGAVFLDEAVDADDDLFAALDRLLELI